MSLQSNVIIIGAGIVGLATAYQLSKKRPDWKIVILEKESQVAAHQTGHNSGVVHSGVYYKPGSLKAKNCIDGKKELLSFCEEHQIPVQKLGKVIVATKPQELEALQEIERRGIANQIPGLEMIGPERLKEIEPHVKAIKALWIPDSYIIHYPAVAKTLADLLMKSGVTLLLGTEVKGIQTSLSGTTVETTQGVFHSQYLINCAGLHSDRIARKALSVEEMTHQILPFRGEYYQLVEEKRRLVKGLIYPVPDPKFPFLGVHLTRMINGGVEAGPNAVLALAREGYKKGDFSPKDCLNYLRYSGFWKMAFRYWKVGMYELYRSWSKTAFLNDLQQLIPEIEEKDLLPGGSGVRAQVVTKEGKMLDDFAIVTEHRSVHVLNAPSPAATASFSIGRTIAEKVSSISREKV